MPIEAAFDHGVAALVPGCPLERPKAALQVCADCSYNVVAPQTATIGCRIRFTVAEWRAALNHLKDTHPNLADELNALIQKPFLMGRADQVLAERWENFARRWYEARPQADGAEKAMMQSMARFARASVVMDQPVRIFG